MSLVPPFLDEIVRRAARDLAPLRIYLYGSRARGTHRPRSDVDLAFELGHPPDASWARFVTAMDEEAPTLLPLDLIALESAPAHLARRIREEGKVLYERQ